jgi:hypothetical protein
MESVRKRGMLSPATDGEASDVLPDVFSDVFPEDDAGRHPTSSNDASSTKAIIRSALLRR